MRRARQFGNPTLGVTRIPVSASDENDANAQRALEYNKAAAAQYASMRDQSSQAEDNQSDTQQGTEAARIALAKALGHDPNNAPPLASMMARYYSLPANVQAGIYKQGGAQFIDGKTGMKMLQSVADDREKALDAHTNELGTRLANGEINYDVNADGKPSFYQLQKDPNDMTGLAPKLKVPLNTLQLALMDRGFKKGLIPNPFNPDSQNGALATPQKQTSADFQQVLDARAANGGASDTDQFQQVLNARAAGTDLSANKTPSTAVPQPASDYAPPLPTAPPTSGDFFVNAGNATRALPGRIVKGLGVDTSEGASDTMSNVGDAIGATAAAFPNTVLRAMNASRRFFGGEGGGQYGQQPLIPVDAQQTAEDPAVRARRLAMEAAMANENQQNADVYGP